MLAALLILLALANVEAPRGGVSADFDAPAVQFVPFREATVILVGVFDGLDHSTPEDALRGHSLSEADGKPFVGEAPDLANHAAVVRICVVGDFQVARAVRVPLNFKSALSNIGHNVPFVVNPHPNYDTSTFRKRASRAVRRPTAAPIQHRKNNLTALFEFQESERE